MLCAPSLEDVIITIRSRSRHVRLRTPSVEAVADLLERRDGVDPPMALYAARAAQSHIGLARRLARDERARIRRRDVVAMATKIVGGRRRHRRGGRPRADRRRGVAAPRRERDAAERARLLETLGADPTARTQPPHIRSQVASLEKEQKARATRFTPRHGRPRPHRPRSRSTATRSSLRLGAPTSTSSTPTPTDGAAGRASVLAAEQVLGAMDAIGTARERINANVPPLLALEAMALELRLPALSMRTLAWPRWRPQVDPAVAARSRDA